MAVYGGPSTIPVPSSITQWSNIAVSSSTTSTTAWTINTHTNTALVINNKTGGAVLTIHYDGSIEYTGKPSKAADTFLQSLAGHIDWKAAGTAALEKTYRRAIKRCLNQAKTMTHEEFIAALEKEVDSRTSKAVLKMLTEDYTDVK